MFPTDGRPRIDHIGKNNARAAEYIVLDSNSIIDGDVILDFDIGTDNDIVADKNILPQRTIGADVCAGANMAPMPDARACADFCPIIDNGGRMNEIRH